MVTTAFAAPEQKTTEDALAYLPPSITTTYPKGKTIYGAEGASTGLYFVIGGKVKVWQNADGNRQVIVDIYGQDEFFGEYAIVGLALQRQSAVAQENTVVMRWNIGEIEDLLHRNPKLAIALLQMVTQRCGELGRRIESFALDSIAGRLARALIRFSERLGEKAANGSIELLPLTHEFLAQYVGTSREIVTHYMNRFRREGYLHYSRKGITLHSDCLRDGFGRIA